MKKVIGALICSVLLTASQANATVSVSPLSGITPEDINGFGTIDPGDCDFSSGCTVAKFYTDVGEMVLRFAEQNGETGDLTITETITNNTTSNWIEFFWEIQSESDAQLVGVPIVDIFTVNPTLTTTTSFTADGGSLAPLESFVAVFTVRVTIGGSTFDVAQLPTAGPPGGGNGGGVDPSIPEPGTLAIFGLGLACLGYNRRKQVG